MSVNAHGGVRDHTIHVASRRGAYPVRLGSGVLDDLPDLLDHYAPAHRYALISDSRVWGLHGTRVASPLEAAGLDFLPLVFPEGETSKDVSQWERLSRLMIEAGFGRDSAVLGLGGGVTTDLAGFVAATYMRGVPLVQIPTSVLAMVDASIGGKAGVNLPAGKNLLGAFHAPRLVVTDPTFIGTQSPEARVEGWVEAVKHGAVLDVDHLAQIHGRAGALREGDPEASTEVLARTIAIKAAVVGEDELERGRRELLNFGHTLGHAIERVSNWRLSHGRAVALGMRAESRAAELQGLTPEGTSERLAGVLSALGVHVGLGQLDPAAIVDATVHDKKVRRGTIRFVVLAELGRAHPQGLMTLDAAALRQALAELL